MALPRKDLRSYFDHDIHAAITAIADTEGVDPGAWIEQVIVGVVKKRVHNAKILVARLDESGASGTFTDERG